MTFLSFIGHYLLCGLALTCLLWGIKLEAILLDETITKDVNDIRHEIYHAYDADLSSRFIYIAVFLVLVVIWPYEVYELLNGIIEKITQKR